VKARPATLESRFTKRAYPKIAFVANLGSCCERLGVVAELTCKQRGRVFSYARYVDILNEGMTLPDGAGRR
jgi:hypothetical protein